MRPIDPTESSDPASARTARASTSIWYFVAATLVLCAGTLLQVRTEGPSPLMIGALVIGALLLIVGGVALGREITARRAITPPRDDSPPRADG